MLTLESCVYKSEQVPFRIIEEEAVLVDVDNGSVIQLNEVGAFIWKNIDGERTVREIVACVYDEFSVDKNKVEQDAVEFLAALLKKQLIAVK